MRRMIVAVGLVLLAAVPVACADEGGDAAAPAPTSRSPASTTSDATSGSTRRSGCSSEIRRDVQYRTPPGDPPAETTLDVHPAPDACAAHAGPVVVWVHGGGWSVGDKANVGAKLDLFHGLGAAVVSVNYRLAPRPLQGDPAGVHHPEQAEDVAAAVAWARGHAASFGADPDRIVLIGHSAGGHLVALVGTDPRFLRDAGVADGALRCVVALDTEGYDLAEKVSIGGPSEALVRNAFGDDPAVWSDASPIAHAGDASGAVPFLIVTRGAPRRQGEAVRFADALDAAGADARVVRAIGYTHADVNRRLGEPGEAIVTPAVTDFVRECASVTT